MMNNVSIKALLIIGIFIAMLTIFNNISIANAKSIEMNEIEQYQLAESIINGFVLESKINIADNPIFKIYNCDNKLVYEIRNEKDQKLKILLIKSDLLTTIDNISYYKLSH